MPPRSTARIAGHPVHPMLVPFPIAFLVGTLVSDLAFAVTSNPGWATASLWLLGTGIVTALVAAVAGFADFLGDARIRDIPDSWHHMIGNLVAVLLALVNLLLRLAAEAAILPWGLILSALVVATLLFTGWKGGELVYRHGVGVELSPSNRGTADSPAGE